MPIPYFPNSNWWSLPFMASVMTAVAIVVAFYIAYKETKRKDLNLDMFFISALWMGAWALIGGRLAYFLTPGRGFLNIYLPGSHSWGVILGSTLGLLIYSLYKKELIRKEHKRIGLFFGKLGDSWVPGAAIAFFFYRIGCFLTHCIETGTLTNLSWAVLDNGVARHPINIYYSLAGLGIFVVIIGLRNSKKIRFDGEISLWFLILYFGSRFFLDFLRESSSGGMMDYAQIIYLVILVLIMLHLIPMYILYKIRKKKEFYYPPYDLVKHLLENRKIKDKFTH